MTAIKFFIGVSHAQVTVFDRVLEQPFNAWTDQHVKQGFSWRPGSVSFATIEEAGQHEVTIDFASGDVDLSPAAVRIIETPFEVPQDGSIEIASISNAVLLSLPAGIYALRFEYFCAATHSKPAIRFIFMRAEHPAFKILRADAGLAADTNHLLLSASPA